jgi:hypothetical protein
VNSPPPDIAFYDLLSALQKEGFKLSPTDYVEFTAVFNQFTGSREELKYYLAPILCRNQESQLKFYALYDRFTTPPATTRQRTTEPTTNPYLTDRTATWFLYRASRQVYGWFFLLSLIAVIIRVAPLMTKKRVPARAIVTQPDSTSVATQPIPQQVRKFKVKPIRPAHQPTPEEKSILTPTGPEVEKENSIYSSAFAWLFVLGMTSLLLSMTFFPLRRSRSRPHVDIGEGSTDHGPLDIPFRPRDHLIRNLPILAKLARDLAQPIPTDHYRLEVNATIRESINAHGLITPVFANIVRRPEWLAIIALDNPLRKSLFRYFCRTLRSYSLPIDYYYYDGAGNYYTEDSTQPINSYQLHQRHGDAQVIGFGPATLPEPIAAAFDFSGPLRVTNINYIRQAFDDEDLFQWLCALAVYPTVRWEVTLAVGAAVLKHRNALHKLNFASLLKLTNFTWLATSTGYIPTDIRLELLKALGLPEELVTRQTILELLQESDNIILAGTASFEEKMHQVYTQSFVLFAHDTRRNRSLEADARQFMSQFDRQHAADLATVIYLRNPDHQWATPIRSAEDPNHTAGAERFIQELLALKVIANPRIRTVFRTLSASLFFLLLLLYLFSDNLQPTALNASLNLVTRDYPTGAVTVNIPVTPCLRQITPGHYLLVTLNNYDNNRYSQLFDLTGRDTLRARFDGVTMTGKDSSLAALQLMLNKTLTIDCPAKAYYTTYTLNLRGDDCDTRLPEVKPAASTYKPPPGALQQ